MLDVIFLSVVVLIVLAPSFPLFFCFCLSFYFRNKLLLMPIKSTMKTKARLNDFILSNKKPLGSRKKGRLTKNKLVRFVIETPIM